MVLTNKLSKQIKQVTVKLSNVKLQASGKYEFLDCCRFFPPFLRDNF